MSLAEFFSSVIKSVSSLNDRAKDIVERYAPTPTNIFQGGGRLIQETGNVVGQTARNILSPIFPILAVLVFVYAFGSNR